MAAPVCSHVGEVRESMRNTMIQFRLVGIRLCVGLRDTLRHHLRVALFMASVLAIRTLHSGGIF